MVNEIFLEFDYHLMNDNNPSTYFNQLVSSNRYPNYYPFNLLYNLINIEQNSKYHPEGSVWNHTMQVVDNGVIYNKLSTDKRIFMWATLLHDIGKGTTTTIRKGRITSYNHEKEGEILAKKFLRECNENDDFAKPVSKLVRWHMEPFFVNKKLPYSQAKFMAKEVPVGDIAILSLCDKLGRGKVTKEKEFNEILNLLSFINNCYDKYYIDSMDSQIIVILKFLSDKINDMEKINE
jgi:putative nucleotidyltransferase with HDIG domain